MKLPKLKQGEALILRCCKSDGTSRNGFTWPEKGTVAAPDWEPNPECGNGLHGWLRGAGDVNCWTHNLDDLWIVAAVSESDCIDLSGKVKFPSCRVLYRGNRETAVQAVQKAYPASAVIFGTATAGDRGTAAAGDSGTATAGTRGTATAGDSGTATAGDSGTATAGYAGTATAGDSGTATAGTRGTATAGDSGTATAGDRGTAAAGDSGIISIRHYDPRADRYRVMIGYVGEGGLKPGVAYKLNDQAQFVEAN